MFNLNATLDNLIAMVVVLLALSLVVQAVQSAVKKMFKLKSRQIEDSLAHLFQFVIDNRTAAAVTPGAEKADTLWAMKWKGWRAMIEQSPFLRIFLRWVPHPAENASYPEASRLYNEVLNQFRAIGRTALSTRPIFDSLSKADLLKVVASLDPEKVDASFLGNFTNAVSKLAEVYRVFMEWEGWFKGPGFTELKGLGADDRQRLADMYAKVGPLLHDLCVLLTGEAAGGNPDAIKPPAAETIKRLAADIARLRSVNLADAQKVIDDVASNVEQAAARAQAAADADVAAGLRLVAASVRRLSVGFAAFRNAYAAVFARWVKLEDSFDSVMQSFEERYTRSMKTAALFISFAVVVFLNANFFSVYTEISTSDAKRELIIQSRDQVVEALARELPAPSAEAPPPGETPEQRAARELRERQQRDAATRQTVQTWLRASQEEINKSAETFVGYGFTPIGQQDLVDWFEGWTGSKDRWANFKHDLRVLLGWIVMTLLLSVGAPFWQDFLESLFGVKNVLRKRSDTKNVEQESGAGQPRQS